jgi:catechol 2,3-dioxygenase-like lactoylglutathione lyase family enzyme
MKLEFLYTPVKDLQSALALYRDALGWEEAWREGDSTVSLKLPGTDVQLMLDEAEAGEVGPLFVVENVERFHADRPRGLTTRAEPQEIPGGFLVTYADASGNAIYVMDQALESSGAEADASGAQAV